MRKLYIVSSHAFDVGQGAVFYQLSNKVKPAIIHCFNHVSGPFSLI